ACATYEFQVQRICDGNETSDFSGSVEWTLSGCCTPVTVEIATDRWGTETTWSLTDGVTVCASGGPYTNSWTNGTYPRPSIEACLPDGSYEVIVHDEYGDGNCCQYGNGDVEVVNEDEDVLALVAGDIDQNDPAIEEFCVSSSVSIDLKVWLQGAYGNGALMNDELRSNGLVPLHEPYSLMGFSGGDEFTTPAVLAVT